jgi:hypothetical protein
MVFCGRPVRVIQNNTTDENEQGRPQFISTQCSRAVGAEIQAASGSNCTAATRNPSFNGRGE